MASEGPYKIDAFQACEPWKRLIAVGPSIRFGENGIPPNAGEMVDLLNTAYAEGRKAAEKEVKELEIVLKSSAKYFEMLKKATGVEHGNLKEINAVLCKDENEHDAIVEKGTEEWCGYKDGKCHTEKDLKDLLRMANKLRGFDEVFDAWEKARGLE